MYSMPWSHFGSVLSFSLSSVWALLFFLLLLLIVCMRWDGEWSKGGMKGKKDTTIEYSLCAIQLTSSFIIQGKTRAKKKNKVQGVKKSEDGLGVGVDKWVSGRVRGRRQGVCFVVVVSEYERV